jgi:hypothetical protein
VSALPINERSNIMGYRSEVAVVIAFKDEAQRDTFLALQLAKKDDDINEALKEVKKLETNKLFYYASDVKWYESYDFVKAVTNLYLEAVELYGNDGAGYRFTRIGEEVEDIEISEDGDYDDLWDYTSINRSIDVDVDESKLTAVINEEGVLA